MTITRRQLLAGTAASVLPRVLKSADQADLSRMIMRSPKPEDLEMPLDGFLNWITPVDRFFVRCHTYTPHVNLSEWTLKIDGKVDRPVTITMDDLRKFPRVELVAVVECAGNGRSFYEPRVAGTQWAYGSVGNGRWTGVRLRDVLQKAGIQTAAREILFNGADAPLGRMPDFQRSIPTAKALDPDTLLAFEMNGQTLPVQHGFPLRVIAPGWASDSWVKWLEHIEVLDHEFDGFWMKSAYRHPLGPVAPGTAVNPADMTPVTDLKVKSVIATPVARAQPGTVRVQGTAWSNSSPVAKVEVSTDAGKTWERARLEGPATQYGWRLWRFDWRAAEGEYKLMSRATNKAGQSQPLSQQWNPSGYLWNVAQPVSVTVSTQPPPATPQPAVAATPPPESLKTACFGCHDDHMLVQQHLTRAQWSREIDKMTGWSAPLKPEDRAAILDYLSTQFK